MKVILATWYNNYNDVYMMELYDSDVFESEILDHYKDSKDLYGHKVLSRSEDTIVFTDGSRAVLTYKYVKNSVFDMGEYKERRESRVIEPLRLAE